jgi:hypothetical protein
MYLHSSSKDVSILPVAVAALVFMGLGAFYGSAGGLLDSVLGFIVVMVLGCVLIGIIWLPVLAASKIYWFIRDRL